MRFFRWLAPLMLGAVLFAAPLHAQAPAGQAEERNPPAPQYALLSLSLIAVLVILCIPSRKRVAS